MIPLARDLPAALAECSRCTEAQESDRWTVDEALATKGWAVIDNELICDAHLTTCTQCGDPCLLDQNGCVDNVSWHCSEHWQDCGHCGRWDMAQGREPFDD